MHYNAIGKYYPLLHHLPCRNYTSQEKVGLSEWVFYILSKVLTRSQPAGLGTLISGLLYKGWCTGYFVCNQAVERKFAGWQDIIVEYTHHLNGQILGGPGCLDLFI